MAHHVVVVGGGFGGLEAARRLARVPGVRVTLLDRQNYHLFQPLLYQVATAGLSPGDIASPIRNLVAAFPNVEVRMADVQRVELASKRVVTSESVVAYDSLVLAAGVRHGYFGHANWEGDAPGLKTLDDALEIRRRVLLAFENAEREEDAVKRAAWLTFVVVGGGPTGVELAGAISELSRFTVAKDFRRFDPRTAKVVLVEAGSRVLAAFDTGLSGKARASLERLQVDVRLSTRVTDVTTDGVALGDQFLPARTVLWAAGIEGPPLAKTLGVELDRSGRVKVNADLSVPGHNDVYVIGDLANFTEPDGTTLPGLAPVAQQQGRHVARVIEASLEKSERPPFRYVDKGIMATVGRASGIAQAGRLKLSGMLGWMAWLFIHVLFLIGFRNRVLVLLQWAWAWFTYGRSARLITGTTPVPLPSGHRHEVAPVAERQSA